MINLNPLNIDTSQILTKLGEPGRLMAILFGVGALLASVSGVGIPVAAAFILNYIGLGAIGATIAGYLNPVKVGAPPKTMNFNLPGGANFVRAGPKQYWRKQMGYAAGSGPANILPGRVQPTYGTAYGAGEVVVPAGPATNQVKAVQFDAVGREPMYLRYITGVENEGKVIGQA